MVYEFILENTKSNSVEKKNKYTFFHERSNLNSYSSKCLVARKRFWRFQTLQRQHYVGVRKYSPFSFLIMPT